MSLVKMESRWPESMFRRETDAGKHDTQSAKMDLALGSSKSRCQDDPILQDDPPNPNSLGFVAMEYVIEFGEWFDCSQQLVPRQKQGNWEIQRFLKQAP